MKTSEYTAISQSDYLTLEARSPVRHEYIAGEIFAMTGASIRHNDHNNAHWKKVATFFQRALRWST